MRAMTAGLLYALVVFAIGFVLGTLRLLVVVPRIGELAAVLIELPLILALALPIGLAGQVLFALLPLLRR